MPVYDSDAALPALPLPSLNITAELVKELARPAAPPETWKDTATAAAALKQQGLRLQERLKTHQLSLGGNLSWLRPHWDDEILRGRDPVPLTGNAALRLHPEKWGMHPLPAFILGMCKFIQRAAREDLPQETSGAEETADGTEPPAGKEVAKTPSPLSMYSLRRMFADRRPGRTSDSLAAATGSVPARVAVVHRGRWFILTLSDASGNCTTVNAVAQALDSIVEIAAKLPEQPAVGAATSAPRGEAAELRDRLMDNPDNRISMAAIEDALFVVALNAQTKGSDFGADLLAGDAADRWFDKSLQVIYGPAEEFGLTVGTAGADIGFWLYALNQIDKEISSRQLTGSPRAPVNIRSLAWRVDDALRTDLERLRFAHSTRTTGLTAALESWRGSGRERMADCGCDPEVFVHLALLTAYARFSGEIPPAALDVSMRHFYQGRTEVVRLATSSATAFARELAGGGSGADSLRQLYGQAEAEHRTRLEHCRNGMGVERHLFGLRKMAEATGAALPDIFASPGWQAATRNTLTVQAGGGDLVRHCALPPLQTDGLAVSYGFGGVGELFLSVTGRAESVAPPARFAEMTHDLIERMLGLFGSAR